MSDRLAELTFEEWGRQSEERQAMYADWKTDRQKLISTIEQQAREIERLRAPRYRCAGCGQYLEESEITGNSHIVPILGKNGEPEPFQCGPVYDHDPAFAAIKNRAKTAEARLAQARALLNECYSFTLTTGEDGSLRETDLSRKVKEAFRGGVELEGENLLAGKGER